MLAQFPHDIAEGLGHFEKALHHIFSSSILLAEALVMSSCKSDNITPDFQRLDYVGETVAEHWVTRMLVESAQFCNAATLSHTDQSDSASTFAVRANVSLQSTNDKPKYAWPSAKGLANTCTVWPLIEGVDLSTFDKLEHFRAACCNNEAYARTCVRLGLHKGMREGSAELTKNVKTLVHAMQRSKQDEQNQYPRLQDREAKRALSNTFVACIGAIVMDSAHNVQEHSFLHARKVLLNHIENCKTMFLTAARSPDLESDDDCSNDTELSSSQGYQSSGGQEWNGKAKWCDVCEMMSNSEPQYDDHVRGKKHKKNVKKGNATNTTVTTSVSTTKSQKKKKTKPGVLTNNTNAMETQTWQDAVTTTTPAYTNQQRQHHQAFAPQYWYGTYPVPWFDENGCAWQHAPYCAQSAQTHVMPF